MKKIILALFAFLAGMSSCVEDNPFIGFTAVTQSPSVVTSANAVLITATASGVQEAELVYWIDGVEQTPIAMTPAPNPPVAPFIGVKFTAALSIPAQVLGTVVTYRVEALGVTETVSPFDRTYTVGLDYTQLVINEVNGNVVDFIELYNKGVDALPLTGVTLVKNGAGTWWTGVAANGSLAAGAYVSIINPGTAPLAGQNGISGAQNLQFQLFSPGSVLLDTFLRTNGGTLGASVTPAYTTYSFGRVPNATGTFFLTISSQNAANGTSEGPIVTN